VPSGSDCILKVFFLNSIVFVFTTLHLVSCVYAGDCEGTETIAFVMAWRQKRGIRRDSGRMKQVEKTVWRKSECNDKS
jgi:hypothetical protein